MQSSSSASHVGAENAEVVRDGDRRTLPCSSSEGRPYRWKWCRPASLDHCQPAPLEVEADGQSLSRTFHATSTTGVYSCVAKTDENTVFDVYYQLTAGKQRSDSRSRPFSSVPHAPLQNGGTAGKGSANDTTAHHLCQFLLLWEVNTLVAHR